MSEENPGKRKRGRKTRDDDSRWTDKEMLDFAIAIQRYGSADIKNIALAVKTKSENTIKAYIDKEVDTTRRRMFKGKGIRKRNIQTFCPQQGGAADWPALRKWQKIAQNQMVRSYARNDLSCLIMPQVVDRFRAECTPPSSDQEVDVGLVYGWIGECLRGRNPPELPPKESALVLMLMRLLREMKSEMDLKEETAFITKFKKATQFVPFKMKDEFRKKDRKVEEVLPPGTVRLPEDIYAGLSRHRKLVQSFNPLQVPVWHLEKEQEFFVSMFKGINLNKESEELREEPEHNANGAEDSDAMMVELGN